MKDERESRHLEQFWTEGKELLVISVEAPLVLLTSSQCDNKVLKQLSENLLEGLYN